MRLLHLLADIRKAAGDPHGKLMQDELVAHIADLQKDAERYRFLRNIAHTIDGMSPAVVLATARFDVDSAECGGFVFAEDLDSAVDASRIAHAPE